MRVWLCLIEVHRDSATRNEKNNEYEFGLFPSTTLKHLEVHLTCLRTRKNQHYPQQHSTLSRKLFTVCRTTFLETALYVKSASMNTLEYSRCVSPIACTGAWTAFRSSRLRQILRMLTLEYSWLLQLYIACGNSQCWARNNRRKREFSMQSWQKSWYYYKNLYGINKVLLFLNEHGVPSFLFQNLSSYNIKNE